MNGDGEPIVLTFRGRVPSKKNRYTPRKDRPGFFKDARLKSELDRIALQIPGWARDLKLESPVIDVHFKYVTANWDRTNAWQGLEDLLVDYGVIFDDNIKRSNSLISLHPAEKSDYDGVTVVLTPRVVEPEFQRYVRPRRRTRFSVPPTVAPPEPEPDEDYLDGIEWDA